MNTETTNDVKTTKEYKWVAKKFPELSEDERIAKMESLKEIQTKLKGEEYKEAKKFLNASKPFYKKNWVQLAGTTVVTAIGTALITKAVS